MAEAFKGKHVVIFSRSCLFLSSEKLQQEMNEEIRALSQNGNFELHFTSHENPTSEMLGAIPKGLHIAFQRRGQPLRAFIKQRWEAGDVVIICGAVDEDLYVATNTKSFLLAALWVDAKEIVRRYGVPAPTPKKMRAILNIVVNQTSWYYMCSFVDPVPTKVVSLCCANTYAGSSVSEDEKKMAEAFEAILKDGAKNPIIKEALLCHLMAAIAHDRDFREVQDWAVAPPSSPKPNEILTELKDLVRYMMNGKKSDAVFKRHTQTQKSRCEKASKRQDDDYIQKHFRSICVSDAYKDKLKGRVVCVFDDYLTNGQTFEALRNLLVSCKVKKIIFVSIGKFKRGSEFRYTQRHHSIEGNLYSADYKATFVKREGRPFEINDAARRSLADLRELACHLC
ncbi:uncharacterized protein [Montipora capricornis]|uniref:uncharacterized protein n=1 Tax=Montipora capricornis TaxID=246305 RepID=UPI0035F0FC05